MEPGKPSQTAISAALFRAVHLHLFDGPKIHEDTFALEITGVGLDGLLAFADQIDQLLNVSLRRASAYFAYRHRVTEERLQAAVDLGVRQVVLLGAGLDSFALRHPDVPKSLRFVEVDHPDSQRWKRERIASLGLDTSQVHYVPVDFASQSLREELARAGVTPEQPAFFSWLGVTQYIGPEAMDDTLSLVAGYASKSEIVFDVTLPVAAQPSDERVMSNVLAEASRVRGEPWVSYLLPDALEPHMVSLGFSRIERFTSETARAYYKGQPADVQPVSMWQLLSASV
jgi:methyltransferase (TIGR00027 family)